MTSSAGPAPRDVICLKKGGGGGALAVIGDVIGGWPRPSFVTSWERGRGIIHSADVIGKAV